MVSAARARVENLAPDDFARAAEEDAIVVDLREPDEVARDGSIPGAILVPRGMLEFTADPETRYFNPAFQEDRAILLYCASGSRSALAAVTLAEMGYTNVAHLADGLRGWLEAGGTLETPSD
jgi:rhodanese-related sulfurtransferase